MKKNIKNKEYTMEETVAYYILGYRRYKQNKKQNELGDILKNILEVAQENINTTNIKGIDIDISKIIDFSWILSGNDFVAYAVCIFYVLINREKIITDEKIIKEFLTELHSHHPRRTMKEAKLILENFFPNLKN